MDPDLDLTCSIGRTDSTACSGSSGRYSLRSTACQPDHRRDRSSNPFGCPGPVDCRRGRVCACRGSADALVYRLGSVSDQCLDQWIGQCCAGVGRSAMDHIVAGGRAAPVGVATDGSGDELRRPWRRCHSGWPGPAGLRRAGVRRGRGRATGVGAVAAQGPS